MRLLTTLARRTNNFLESTTGLRLQRASNVRDVDAAVGRLRSWAPGDVIFDVGAHDGRTLLRLYEQLPSPRVFAFEPVSATYRMLVERTRHLGNVSCFPLALGAQTGRREIYLKKHPVVNSFYPDWSTSVGRETVDVTTVDAVMDEYGIDFIHLLKVDTEGHDLEVLRGARAALASSRVAIIQVEVNLKRRRLGLERFRAFLGPMGYRLSGVYTQKRLPADPPASWTQEEKEGYAPYVLRYCDAVFVGTDGPCPSYPGVPENRPNQMQRSQDTGTYTGAHGGDGMRSDSNS